MFAKGKTRATTANSLRNPAYLNGLAIVLFALIILSLGAGAVKISPIQVLGVLLKAIGISTADPDLAHSYVLLSIRLPRIAFALLIGSSLAVAGACLQSVYRNPLADPALIGVSSGAAVGVALTLVASSFFAGTAFARAFFGIWSIPIAGFLGGLAATLIVFKLATRNGRTDVATMLLAGIAINAFCGALIGLMSYLADDAQLRDLTMWTLGSLSGANWTTVLTLTPFVLVGLVVLWRSAHALNVLLLGEAEAFHLGTDVDKLKRRVVITAALMVGAGVGFAGVIGFVGLVVPHILRLFAGAEHRFVLPGSALLGALMLVAADLVARTIAAPAEIPIGVITALLGAPFFIWLLLKNRNKWRL